MVRNCRVPVRRGAEPNFVTSSGVPVEFKPEYLQLPGNFPVSKSRQSPHLGSNDYGEVSTLGDTRQLR